MMGMSFPEWSLTISNYAVLIGANLMVQSTIILIMGLCATYILRKKGAATQSLVLHVFLIAVIICPIVSIFMYIDGIKTLTFAIPMESFEQLEINFSPVQTGLHNTGKL